MEVRQRVREVVVEDGWALVKVTGVPDRPGIAAEIFGAVSDAEISVDLIFQNASVDRLTDVSFTVRQPDGSKASVALEGIASTVEAKKVEALEGLAKVQLVGMGILSDPVHVGRLFSALAEANVNVIAIGTSEIRISCLIRQEDQKRAREALDAAFRGR